MTSRLAITLAAAALIGALPACSTTGASAPETGRGATADTGAVAPVGARVAVLKTVFGSNASALKETAHAYCVSTGADIDSEETDPAVLAALRDNPKVKPRSTCAVAEGGNGVFDRQSRQPSLLFNVRTASCSADDDCLIYGSYYEGNLSAQQNRYRARLVDGVWAATLDEMGPIA